jgi:uncharacterized protein (TIGR03067 family)
LRRQARSLLTGLADGDAAAARTFIDHLPAARSMSPARVRAAGFRLADAQSAVARKSGFGSWPALSRHVRELRALEGEWRFVSLEADGRAMPEAAFAASRLLIDGDRFRTESPEAVYEGVFTIDVEASPSSIDIEFVEGSEAGNWSYGIYGLRGDELTMCLGLVGASRPASFASAPGSRHALERFRRASPDRPHDVHGGRHVAAGGDVSAPRDAAAIDDAAFTSVAMTPLMRRLEGEWSAVELIRDGQHMPNEWLAFGSRRTSGNETTVVFGGQVMVRARVRVDETTTPVAVDYLNLAGAVKGRVSLGVMEWIGDDVRFNMSAPGQPRPADFTPGRGRTVSRWRRARTSDRRPATL